MSCSFNPQNSTIPLGKTILGLSDSFETSSSSSLSLTMCSKNRCSFLIFDQKITLRISYWGVPILNPIFILQLPMTSIFLRANLLWRRWLLICFSSSGSLPRFCQPGIRVMEPRNPCGPHVVNGLDTSENLILWCFSLIPSWKSSVWAHLEQTCLKNWLFCHGPTNPPTIIQGSNDVIISKTVHQKIPLQILLGQTKSGNQGIFFTFCVLKFGLFHKARPDFFGRLATGVEDTVLSQRN